MMKSAKSVSRMQRRSQSKWETTKIKFPTLSASHWDDAEDLLPGLVMAFGKQRALLGELDAVADSATATPTTLPPLPPAGASSSTPAAEASESDSHRASEPSGKGQKRKSTCISPSSRSNSPFNPKIPRTESASIECACQEDASECHAIGCRNKSVAPRFGALPHQAVTEQALLVNASPKETPRKLHSMAKSMAKLPPQQGRKAERVSRDVLSKLSSPLPSPSSRLPRSYAIEAIEDHRVLAKRGGHSNGDRVHEFLVKWEGYAERSWVKADCFDRYGDMFRAACKRFGVCLWPTTALCKSAVARHVDLNLNSLTSADDKSFASQLQELLRDALSVSTFGWQKLCSDSHHTSVLLRVYCQTVVAGVTYRRLDHDLVYIENLAVVRSEQGRPEHHGTMLARELLMQLPQEDADVTVVLKSLPSAVEFYKALGFVPGDVDRKSWKGIIPRFTNTRNLIQTLPKRSREKLQAAALASEPVSMVAPAAVGHENP